jgi:hypothetical protein
MDKESPPVHAIPLGLTINSQMQAHSSYRHSSLSVGPALSLAVTRI